MFKQLAFICVLIFSLNATGQTKSLASRDSNLIQFSGLLLSSDSIYPIPFAFIHAKNKPYGTYSNLEGYFSFVARAGDTIQFNHVEFKNSYMIIPDTLKDHKYSVVKLLTKDTVFFEGAMIVAMPPRATFDHLFATKEIPNDDVQRAKENLEREAIREQAGSMSGADASEAYRYMARSYALKSYYAGGQLPPMNLMNPFAWAQFFEAWKRGDYKRKKTTYKKN
jgi:hypothetical protein